MLIAYHPLFFGDSFMADCADLADIEITRTDTLDALVQAASTADALILSGGHYTADLAVALRAPGCRVRWLQFTTAGTEAAARLGVPGHIALSNASSVWAPGVAEHAVAMLLATLRRVPDFERAKAAGRWDHATLVPQLDYIDGARIGLLGLGAIGQGIAARLRPFGAEITAFVRSARPARDVDHVRLLSELDAQIPSLDAVISSLPLTAETLGMVGAPLLARMKPGCVFINVGRGGTVDQPALVAALATGGIRAALDVFEHEPIPPGDPIWAAPNLIISPHLAALGGRAGKRRLHELCRENIARFRDGTALSNPVVLEPVP